MFSQVLASCAANPCSPANLEPLLTSSFHAGDQTGIGTFIGVGVGIGMLSPHCGDGLGGCNCSSSHGEEKSSK